MRSGLHISLLLLLLLVLLAQQPGCRAEEGAASDGDADAEVVAAGQEQRTEVEGKEPSTVPAEFIVSNATLRSVLQRVASPKEQAVIFTTTGLPQYPDAQLEMLSNFCWWLNHSGVLSHTMLLTTNEAAFHRLSELGYPVFLDRLFPEEYRHGIPDSTNKPWDVAKHFWGAAIVAEGFRALYMDSDAIAKQNPLTWFGTGYDVQGLSDWTGPELPPVGQVLHQSCGHYILVPDGGAEMGSMLYEWWSAPPGQREKGLNYHNPCQSTGVWYVEPTPVGIRFMAAMRDRLLHPSMRRQWDQAAWNEVILPFLWGAGDEPPLRYRLLPPALFAGGVHNYEERLEAGLPVDLVVLHAGGTQSHGGAKHATYERLGLFHKNFSLPARPALPPAGNGAARVVKPAGDEEAHHTKQAAAVPVPAAAQPAAHASGKEESTAGPTATFACYGGSPDEVSALVLSLAAALALLGVGGCVAALAMFRQSRELVKRKGLLPASQFKLVT